MGFKIGDNVAVHEQDQTIWVGRVVRHLGDGWFDVERSDEEGNMRKVSAQSLRHLDSVRMRAVPIKR